MERHRQRMNRVIWEQTGRRTFRDVGERFVPDRHQRQQVEEESDERPDQQTTAAETHRGTTAY